VTRNTYVWDDTLLIDGGSLTNHGLCFIGNIAGYQQPNTNALDACRQGQPRLVMQGGSARLSCRVDLTASNTVYSGGLVFWPGSIEEIREGTVEIEGWLIGCDDFSCPYAPTTRLFDLANPAPSTPTVVFGGSSYPVSFQRPSIYIQNENLGASPNDMRFHHLTVDRTTPGETNLDLISHVQVHGDFKVLDGHVSSPATRRLSFRGATPALWAVVEGGAGQSSLSNVQPDLNGKTVPITLRSTIPVPGFALDNPNAGFELRIDDLGAVTGSIALHDGRLVIGKGDLEVRGVFRAGRSTPPLSAGRAPRLDFTDTGTLFVSAFYGGPGHGDFLFEAGASGTMNLGTIRAEGDFRVDNAAFAPGGSHTVELSGNVGRSVVMENLQTPPRKPVPTLILQNFTLAKTGSAPGDTVDVLSDVDIRGTFTHVSGRINWNNANVGSLALAPGAGNPPSGEILPGETDRAVLQFEVTTDFQESIRVTRVTVTALGSGDASADVAGVRLYLDSDGNGQFDPRADLPIAGPSYFVSGRCDLAPSRVLPPLEMESWFLVVSLYDTATVGSDFTFVIGANDDVQGAGLTSNRAAHVTGPPIGSREFTVAALPAPPPPVSDSASCGGGTSASGSDAFLCWALLVALFVLVRRAAVQPG
jgi:hypothetical protein